MSERSRSINQFNQRNNYRTDKSGVFAKPYENGNLKSNDFYKSSQDNKREIVERYRQSREVNVDTGSEFDKLGNKNLPVHNHREEIIATVAENKVSILDGQTGSGKSTQTWKYLLQDNYDKVFVTVPRKIIAENLYERGLEELEMEMGSDEYGNLLGIVHADRTENRDDAKVVFMTPNTYTRMAKSIEEEYEGKKVAIIADEIHEANLYTENSTAIAAQQVHDRDNWRLILSSATRDESLDQRYRDINTSKNVPKISIEGRPFDLDINEEPDMTPAEAYAKYSHENDHKRSMIFTSGLKEMDEIIEQLRGELKKVGGEELADKTEFRKLHGKLLPYEQEYVASPSPEGKNVVIVSTPAGMSGITIPGVTLVVSDGTINRETLDSSGTPGLFRYPAAYSELIQMGGRAGRDVEGGQLVVTKPVELKKTLQPPVKGKAKNNQTSGGMDYIPLSERDPQPKAEIYNSNLARPVLSAAAAGYDYSSLNEYLPHRLSAGSIIDAKEVLRRLGAIDDEDEITRRGQNMDKFPVAPEIGRALVELEERQIKDAAMLGQVAIIAAGINYGGMQDFSPDGKERIWTKSLSYGKESDHLTQLELYSKFGNKEPVDLRERDLDPVKTIQINKLADKIMRDMKIPRNVDLHTPPTPDQRDEIHEIFLTGMMDYIYERQEKTTRMGAPLYVNIHKYDSEEEGLVKKISDRFAGNAKYLPHFVAGTPRRYTKSADPNAKMNYIIENVMPVQEEWIRNVAEKDQHLLEMDKGSYYVENTKEGKVRRSASLMLGTLAIREVKNVESINHKEVFETLKKDVIENPTKDLMALYSVRDQLNDLKNKVGNNHFDGIARRRLLDDELINEIIKDAVENSDSRESFNNNIRVKSSRPGGLSLFNIDTYIDYGTRSAIEAENPDEMEISLGDDQNIFVNISYKDGIPFIPFNENSMSWVYELNELKTPGGKDILIQVPEDQYLDLAPNAVSLNKNRIGLKVSEMTRG